MLLPTKVLVAAARSWYASKAGSATAAKGGSRYSGLVGELSQIRIATIYGSRAMRSKINRL